MDGAASHLRSSASSRETLRSTTAAGLRRVQGGGWPTRSDRPTGSERSVRATVVVVLIRPSDAESAGDSFQDSRLTAMSCERTRIAAVLVSWASSSGCVGTIRPLCSRTRVRVPVRCGRVSLWVLRQRQTHAVRNHVCGSRRRLRVPGDSPQDSDAAICRHACDIGVHGYYTGEHFADSVGWPLALIGFGIFMIALSAATFRIDRDYVRRAS